MKRAILILVASSVLYLLVFPTRLQSELTFEPVWAIDPHVATPVVADDEELFAFRSGTQFGYVNSNGDILFLDSVFDDVSIGTKGFVNYSSMGLNLLPQSPDGSVETVLATRGYPMFYDDRLFVFATNRTRVEEWSIDGTLIWSNDFGSLITAMDANSERTVVGLLDGTTSVFASNGSLIDNLSIEESRISAIYGCGISVDSQIVAVVHGLDPQRLSVFRWEESEYRLVRSRTLESSFRQNRMVAISATGEWIYLESIDSVLSVAVKRADTVNDLKLPGRLLATGAVDTPSIRWFVSDESSKQSTAFASTNGTLYAGSVATNLRVSEGSHHLIVSSADRIGRLDVRRR